MRVFQCRGGEGGKLSTWVELTVHFLQASFIHVGVDLRGADIRVAEHFLNDSQVGPTTEQMCRKAVPQLMRMDGIGQACVLGPFTHDLPDA